MNLTRPVGRPVEAVGLERERSALAPPQFPRAAQLPRAPARLAWKTPRARRAGFAGHMPRRAFPQGRGAVDEPSAGTSEVGCPGSPVGIRPAVEPPLCESEPRLRERRAQEVPSMASRVEPPVHRPSRWVDTRLVGAASPAVVLPGRAVAVRRLFNAVVPTAGAAVVRVVRRGPPGVTLARRAVADVDRLSSRGCCELGTEGESRPADLLARIVMEAPHDGLLVVHTLHGVHLPRVPPACRRVARRQQVAVRPGESRPGHRGKQEPYRHYDGQKSPRDRSPRGRRAEGERRGCRRRSQLPHDDALPASWGHVRGVKRSNPLQVGGLDGCSTPA
jgi:hypothetical protein